MEKHDMAYTVKDDLHACSICGRHIDHVTHMDARLDLGMTLCGECLQGLCYTLQRIKHGASVSDILGE